MVKCFNPTEFENQCFGATGVVYNSEKKIKSQRAKFDELKVGEKEEGKRRKEGTGGHYATDR